MKLSGKTILVTGASGAIGVGIVRAAKQAGAWVSGTYLTNQPNPKDCPADLLKQVDVTQKEQLTQWVAEVLKERNQIDGLVAAAGGLADHTLLKVTEAEWDSVLGSHLTGAFLSLKAVLTPMAHARVGKIVLVTSQSGIHGRFGQSSYAAAKAGVIGLTKSAAKELGRWGIEVNALCPGFTPSKMTETVPKKGWDRAREESALGIVANIETQAELVTWLLSEGSRGITGQVFTADSRVL